MSKLQGEFLAEMGKLDEAEAQLELARKEDPENDDARNYLSLVNEARYHMAIKELYPPFKPNPILGGMHDERYSIGTQRDSLPKHNPYRHGRKIIVGELDRIRLAEVKPMDNVPLSEVIKYLDEQARKSDPEKKGINFIFVSDPNNTNPITGLPIAAPGAESVGTNTICVRYLPALHDVRLGDFLEILLRVADKPIKYSIEDYGVVFSPKGRETTPLYFRTIKVDPNTFGKGLRDFLGLPEGGNGGGNIIETFRQLIGVDTSPPNRMSYNERQGTLLVYASLADLDIIERAVAALNTAPPQLNIKAVFIGLPKREVEAFWEKFGPTNGPPPPGSAKTATLTHAQAAAQLDRLRSMDGVDMLGQLQVTTLSGRQAQISVEDAWTTSTKDANDLATPEKVLSGPTLAIIPHLTPDGAEVQLDLVANVAEFIGYDEPGPFPVGQGGILGGNGAPATAVAPLPHVRVRPVGVQDDEPGPSAPVLGSNGAPATAVSPLPHFRVRQLATSVGVQDGQTLVLVGGFHARGVTVTHHLARIFHSWPRNSARNRHRSPDLSGSDQWWGAS